MATPKAKRRRSAALFAVPANRSHRKMPKMKTKSSAKKRFRVTATGKVKSAQAGKRHGMIKRSNKFVRNARGTAVLADQDGKTVRRWLPYA
jgi:large subunit ribosomal protein L35